jgi:hypothetical protein
MGTTSPSFILFFHSQANEAKLFVTSFASNMFASKTTITTKTIAIPQTILS